MLRYEVNLVHSTKNSEFSADFIIIMAEEVREGDNCPKPATSVHLTFKLPKFEKNSVEEVKFRNTVNVIHAENRTYYSVIHFHGGYCGIQQRTSEDDRAAIFSLWNEGENLASLVEKGDGVTVEPFGGEGTGLKSTRPLPWVVGEDVSFTVTTSRCGDDVYRVRCDIDFRGTTIFMATFQRTSHYPMQKFQSFVEDYYRREGATGMFQPRSCTFTDTHCIVDGTRHDLVEAKFSKVSHGKDVHGNDRCHGGIDESNSFFLHTGHHEPISDACDHGACFVKQQ